MQCGRLILRLAPLLMLVLAGSPIPRDPETREPLYQARTLEQWKGDLLNGSLSPEVRERAAEALGHFGAAAVPALVQALEDPDPEARSGTVEAPGRMNLAAQEAIPELAHALRNATEAQEAARLAFSLAQFGAQAVPVLIEILKDTNTQPVGRGAVAFFLSQIRPVEKNVVEAMGRALGDPHEWVRFSACRGLTALGPDAKHTLLHLVLALSSDTEPTVRGCAAEALGAIGPEAKEAVPALRRAMFDQRIRESAIQALGEIGPAAKDAILELRRIRDRDPIDWIRGYAEEALRKIEGR